jgi:hypothetical protein
MARSGITIWTCLDLRLEESPTDLWLGVGNSERLWGVLDTIVDAREELSRSDVQGLPGTTSYGGIMMGICLDLVWQVGLLPTCEIWSERPESTVGDLLR